VSDKYFKDIVLNLVCEKKYMEVVDRWEEGCIYRQRGTITLLISLLLGG
jgi:hypothetical protein